MITIVEAIYAIQVIVTVTKVSKTSQKLKELVHKVAPDTIRDQLAEYVRCLKEGTNTVKASVPHIIISCTFFNLCS